MNIRKRLLAIVSAVVGEAEKNEAFRASLERALGIERVDATAPAHRNAPSRRSRRRTPAVLDPVELAREGEPRLRTKLDALSLDQLRDVVAQYGMDPGKLVMKWKDPRRVIDRIVELALARATKGDAFRAE